MGFVRKANSTLSYSIVRNLDPAPTEVEVGGLGTFVIEDLGMKRIDDEAAILLILHETGLAEDAEVMGHVHDLDGERFGQLGGLFIEPPRRHSMMRMRFGSAMACSISAHCLACLGSVMGVPNTGKKVGERGRTCLPTVARQQHLRAEL